MQAVATYRIERLKPSPVEQKSAEYSEPWSVVGKNQSETGRFEFENNSELSQMRESTERKLLKYADYS
jgi:hypothetical protein